MLLYEFDISWKNRAMTGEKAELTTRSIPRRSPIQVLTTLSLV